MTVFSGDYFKPRFPLGQLVITPGARKALTDKELILSISRHLRGGLGRGDRRGPKAQR